MTTNPYAYYDDEPLPLKSRPLSVSVDGEEEPDMEPRCPLELKGQFVSMFKLAIRTYRIDVTGNLLECRLPNGDFLQLSREEARQEVSVKGMSIDIDVSQYKTYHFRCYQRGNDLALARLKVWLQPPVADAEKSYHAVAEQLRKTFLGVRLMTLLVLFLVWLVCMVCGDYPFWKFHRAGVLLHPAILNLGVCLIRFVCLILLSVFFALRLFGRVNGRLLRTGVLLALTLPVYYWIMALVPGLRVDNWHSSNVFLEVYFPVYFPLVLNGIFSRYQRADKQLQRENGLLS